MRAAASKRFKDIVGRVAGSAGIYARNFRSKMIVVTFHRVNDWMEEDSLTCGSTRFESFCAFFQQHFRVVPLSEQVRACREGRSMGGTLSITFDDGYQDNSQVAAPVLHALNLPATFFVATSFIGTTFVPPWDQRLKYPAAWMSWDQLRMLRDRGFEIGAHTDSHIDMGNAEPGVVRRELQVCRDRLQRELGVSATLFAYPFGGRGNISPVSVDLVREAGFHCCLGAYGGVNPAIADPFALKRICINGWWATPHQFGFEVLKDNRLRS